MATRMSDDQVSPRPTPTCLACVVRESRVLLIRRAQEPNKGFWSFPGGRVELGETIFEAVQREVFEETGCTVEPEKVFHVYDWITRDDSGEVKFHYVVNYVRCSYRSGEARAASDASEARWVAEPDIADLTMHPFARETALRLLREGGS